MIAHIDRSIDPPDCAECDSEMKRLDAAQSRGRSKALKHPFAGQLVSRVSDSVRQSLITVILVSLAACAPRNESAADQIIAGFGEIGPVRLGMTQSQIEEAIGTTVSRGQAGSHDEISCYYLRYEGPYSGIGFMMNDDRLVRYDVWASGIRTRTGIGTGSAMDEVAASYDQPVRATPHKYTDGKYVSVDDGNGIKLLFETDAAGNIERYRSGRSPEVDFVEGCS